MTAFLAFCLEMVLWPFEKRHIVSLDPCKIIYSVYTQDPSAVIHRPSLPMEVMPMVFLEVILQSLQCLIDTMGIKKIDLCSDEILVQRDYSEAQCSACRLL